MAIKVDELQVLISANAQQFKGELIGVKEELKKLNKSASNSEKAIGGSLYGSMFKATVAGNLFVAGLGKVASGLGGVTKEIIASGSALSRLRVANAAVTANMGMTSAQVRKLRDDLAEANTYGIAAEEVISTLALSGLVKLSENLEFVDARSGETKKGVTALTLAIKDLAAARGIDSDLGIQRISKFIQRGEASFADGLIEISNLNDAYREFAKARGKDLMDLSAQEKAQARLNIVMQEGAKSFGAYAATYNSSGKIISSVGMLIRSVTAEIGANIEPVLRVGSLAILEFFRGIQQAVLGSADSVRNASNRIAGYMVALVRIIGRLLSWLPLVGAGFQRLANFTLSPIKAQGKMQNSLGGTTKKMNETGKATDKLKKKLQGLAGFDEMNVLTKPDAGAGAGGGATPTAGGVGGGGGAFGGLSGIEDTTDEIMKFAKQAEDGFNRVLRPIGDFIKRMKEFKIFGTPVIDILGEVGKWAGIAFLAFQAFSPVLGLVNGLFGGLSGLLAPLGGIFTAMSAPAIAVAGAIGLLVAGLVSAWQNSEEFRNSVVGMFTQFQEVFNQVVAIFTEQIPIFLELLQPLIDAVGRFLVEAFKFLGDIVASVWKIAIKPFVDFILANIIPALNFAIEVLKFVIDIFATFGSILLDVTIPILKVLWAVFENVFSLIGAWIGFIWESTIKPIFQAFGGFITGFVIPIVRLLLGVIRTVWGAIRIATSIAWQAILNIVRPVIEWFDNNIIPIINGIRDAMNNAWTGIKDGAKKGWDTITNTIKSSINWIIDKINGFINGINSMLDGIDNVSDVVGISVDFRLGTIPRLATGGIISSPTVAMIGEAGTEAVLPLDQNTQWAEKVAQLITSSGSGQNGSTVVVQLGDEEIFSKFVEWTNDRSLYSNKALLNI